MRNAGIGIVEGKYISFIDSDDFIIENAYDILVYEAERNNLDPNNWKPLMRYYSEEKQKLRMKKRSFPNKIMDGLEFLKRSYREKKLWLIAYPYSIYRTRLIKDYKILFKKGILHEDNLMDTANFLKAERVMYYDLDFYMRTFHEEGFNYEQERQN